MTSPAPRTVIVFAHPYPDRSRANRALLDAVRALPHVAVHALYDRYPDFAIDIAAERSALLAAERIVWQCPVFWYSVPALLSLWFEKVLSLGWAYGQGGTALHGKRALWVTTTGGTEPMYAPGAAHGRPFEAYVPPVEQTARFCGMRWEPPLIVHGAHRISDEALAGWADAYRARLGGDAAEVRHG